ncbi:MAG: CorA family divalent cation transporter [Actinomycetes bacterium]
MKATKFDGQGAKPFTMADKAILAADTPYAWVDVRASGPADPELEPFLTELGFSDVMAAYATRSEAAGMFQVVNDNLVGATWAADEGNNPALVHFVWDAARLVTVRFGGDRALQSVYKQIEARGPHLFTQPTVVPGVVLDLILASVDRRLTEIDSQIADLDAQIIEHANPSQLHQLRTIGGEITPLARRLPVYLDDLSEALVDPSTLPGMDTAGAQFLQVYQSHVRDTVSRVGDASDAMRSAAQDYQTELANRQGNRINQLTVVSMIFLPVTFLTGYFGMNFQWLINETQSAGIWLALGVILPVLAVVGSTAALSRNGFVIRSKRAARRNDPVTAPSTSG